MEIKSHLHQFIRATFLDDRAELSDDTSLLESGLIDSTGVLELILFLESDFGITVGDEDAVPENLDTINRIAAFVASRQSSDSQPVQREEGAGLPPDGNGRF
jgi:acyl carrier protein